MSLHKRLEDLEKQIGTGPTDFESLITYPGGELRHHSSTGPAMVIQCVDERAAELTRKALNGEFFNRGDRQ